MKAPVFTWRGKPASKRRIFWERLKHVFWCNRPWGFVPMVSTSMKGNWWAAAVGIGLAVVGLVISVVVYMDGIKSSISENRALIQQIHEAQGRDFTQRAGHFKELELGHHAIITGVATSLDDLSYRIGVHAGRHQAED